MITITIGMTPAQFITAVNNNYLIEEITIADTDQGVLLETLFNDNYDYVKNIVKELPVKKDIWIGMKGMDYILALNNNFQEITNADTDNDGFDLRFTLNLVITTIGINQQKALQYFCHPVSAASAPLVDWDDGTAEELRIVSPNDGYLLPQGHTFAIGGTYNITIKRTYSIQQYNTGDGDARYDYQQVDFTQFARATPNIERLFIANTNVITPQIGDFTNITSLKLLRVDRVPNAFIGDFSGMTKLETLQLYDADSRFTGSINNWKSIKVVYLSSEDAFSGDVGNIIGTIETFESFETIPGTVSKNTLRGSFNGAPNFWLICFSKWVDLANKITINIETCPKLIYFSDNGCVIWSGSITGRKDIIYIGVVGLTGSPAALEDISYFYGTSWETMDKPLRMDKWIYIDAFTLYGWTYSAAEINQLLADLWANRDSDRSLAPYGIGNYRNIVMNFPNCAAPTGQGLIDAANLAAYRTPFNDPAMPLWNVYINP